MCLLANKCVYFLWSQVKVLPRVLLALLYCVLLCSVVSHSAVCVYSCPNVRYLFCICFTPESDPFYFIWCIWPHMYWQQQNILHFFFWPSELWLLLLRQHVQWFLFCFITYMSLPNDNMFIKVHLNPFPLYSSFSTIASTKHHLMVALTYLVLFLFCMFYVLLGNMVFSNANFVMLVYPCSILCLLPPSYFIELIFQIMPCIGYFCYGALHLLEQICTQSELIDQINHTLWFLPLLDTEIPVPYMSL